MRRLMACGFACLCRYYLSIHGGSECAYYSIRPRLVTGECVNEFDHDIALDSLDSVPRLQLGKHMGGTCKADSFLDYSFDISEDEARNNLLFQVEDLSVNDNPNSLIVHLVRTVFVRHGASSISGFVHLSILRGPLFSPLSSPERAHLTFVRWVIAVHGA